MNKTLQRFLPIATNGIRSVITPMISLAVSFIVVRYFSKQLWGDFVEYLLFFMIVTNICNWGSTTYLMRTFSQNPKNMIQDWQQFFLARIPICTVFIILIPLVYGMNNTFYLIFWLLSVFVYESFFAVIFYNREYLKSISIEFIGFFTFAFLLYSQREQMTIIVLIQSYAISLVTKAILALLLYFKFLNFKTLQLKMNILHLSLPFFLLAITGFLQSRIDVYTYSFFYQDALLGEYHIISAFLLFSQSIVTILLFPYIKNIYRLPDESIFKIKRMMATSGFIINIIVISSIYFALDIFFDISLTLLQFCIAIFIGFPSYLYSLYIYYLFKKQQEYIVVRVSFFCLILNLTVSLILLSLNLGITGVLLGSMTAQLFCVYYLKFKLNRQTSFIKANDK